MKTNLLSSALKIALLGLCSATLASATTTVVDNYDSLSTGAVVNDFATYGYFGVNAAGSANIVTTSPVSSPNALTLGINFVGSGGFGHGFSRFFNTPLDLTGATISIDVKSSVDLSAVTPFFTFRLESPDGSQLVRLPSSGFFKPTGTGYNTYSVTASSFTQYDAGSAINLTNIGAITFLSFNFGDNLATTLTFDNLTISTAAIPEPSSFALLVGVGTLGLVTLRRRARSV
jgi:hypothetical protein